MLCNFIFYLYETCNKGVLVICCCPRNSESQTRNSYATSRLQYRYQHHHCVYWWYLSLDSTVTGTYIVCTLNTCYSTIQTLALNVACTSNNCHFTVQTLSPILLVLWTPITSEYRHWHQHCLYCEHLSLHCTDTGTCIACTVNTCHFTVQMLAPTLLILRMPVTSLYQQWHHHSLYWRYVSLHSANTGTIIACTEDTATGWQPNCS